MKEENLKYKIKVALINHQLSQKWLIYQLERLYDISLDGRILSGILNGTRRSSNTEIILEKCNEVIDKYEKLEGNL